MHKKINETQMEVLTKEKSSNNETTVDSPVEKSSLDSGQSATEEYSDSNYSSILDNIKKIDFYADDKTEMLEIIGQYNALIEKISSLNDKLDVIRNDELQANILYDDFKRTFAQTVEDSDWGEKLYYALPLYEDYDEKDPWIIQWCEIMESVVKNENRDNIRNFVNRNFYGSVFSLPKDFYYYKVKSGELSEVSADVAKLTYIFASKTCIFFKFVKDLSEQLRTTLQKTITTAPIGSVDDVKRLVLPLKDEISNDREFIESLINNHQDDDKAWDINAKYKEKARILAEVIETPEAFINRARKLYQQVQTFQNEINSMRKQIYASSLMDIYKLYDSVYKSLNDYQKQKELLADIDEASLLYCEKFIVMIKKLLDVIEDYFSKAFNIKPLKKLQVGENFNDFDINWYDVLVAEDAPSAELVQCISSISDTGFAKYNADGKIDFVTRTAKISVDKNKVIPRTTAD